MAVTHVFVTPTESGDGSRVVPVHPSHAVGAGGNGVLLCKEGKVYRVAYTTETRKRITAGDFVLCNRDGEPVAELAEASAPNEVPLDEDASVSPTPIVAGPAVGAFDAKTGSK